MPKKKHSKATPVKIVVVGDGAVGKTCLLTTYTTGHFPTAYIPTIFDNYVGTQTVDGYKVPLSLWDTAGQETYDHCRTIFYADTDVFVVCFSLDNPGTLDNVSSKWINELRQHRGDIPILLVGTKSDLLPTTETPASSTSAKKLARSKNLCDYIECSAYTREGIEDVIIGAIKATFPKPSYCVIL